MDIKSGLYASKYNFLSSENVLYNFLVLWLVACVVQARWLMNSLTCRQWDGGFSLFLDLFKPLEIFLDARVLDHDRWSSYPTGFWHALNVLFFFEIKLSTYIWYMMPAIGAWSIAIKTKLSIIYCLLEIIHTHTHTIACRLHTSHP
jgi:hypothetical protein